MLVVCVGGGGRKMGKKDRERCVCVRERERESRENMRVYVIREY